MSTISSKQRRRHSAIDPLFVLVFLVMVLTLLVFAPLIDKTYDSFSNAPGSFSNVSSGLSLTKEASFAADLQYWNANCSHGWTSDSGCDAIASRAQSCMISIDSVYCSEYDSYLQQFRNKSRNHAI